MSLLKLGAGRNGDLIKEMDMELLAAMPEWLVWCAAGGAGAVALAMVANILEAALELDAQ
jgi:hypothetical protein